MSAVSTFVVYEEDSFTILEFGEMGTPCDSYVFLTELTLFTDAKISTMGEWGLIYLDLSLLNVGIVALDKVR